MAIDQNKRSVARVFDEAFNNGRLEVIDEIVAAGAVDHQHPDEPRFGEHLKQVVRAMRIAFPDLHFEVTLMVADDEWVAVHSVMTETNTGELRRPLMLPPGAPPVLPPTGRPVRVVHMHMIRFQNGLNTELLHLMDTMAMAGQLGLASAAAPEAILT